jgi:hypothetical protein
MGCCLPWADTVACPSHPIPSPSLPLKWAARESSLTTAARAGSARGCVGGMASQRLVSRSPRRAPSGAARAVKEEWGCGRVRPSGMKGWGKKAAVACFSWARGRLGRPHKGTPGARQAEGPAGTRGAAASRRDQRRHRPIAAHRRRAGRSPSPAPSLFVGCGQQALLPGARRADANAGAQPPRAAPQRGGWPCTPRGGWRVDSGGFLRRGVFLSRSRAGRGGEGGAAAGRGPAAGCSRARDELARDGQAVNGDRASFPCRGKTVFP